MGHDAHFLSRLSRVTQNHVGLAMSLYRDPAERVAAQASAIHGLAVAAVRPESPTAARLAAEPLLESLFAAVAAWTDLSTTTDGG